ncbi:MAG: hypothetical protein D6732_25470, partial [Methanobacteriota archaeon]
MSILSNDPDENPVHIPVTLNVDAQQVTFSVDMSIYQSVGYFNPALGDYVTVRGNFNGWVDSTAFKLIPVGGGTYQGVFPLQGNVGDTVLYKFFIHTGDGRPIPNGGWEDSVDVYGGAEGYRGFQLTGGDISLPTVFFNNNSTGFPDIVISPDSIILSVTQGYTTTALMTIHNQGVADLNWEIFTALPPANHPSVRAQRKISGKRLPDEDLQPINAALVPTTSVPIPYADDFEDANFTEWTDDGGSGIKEVTNQTAASGTYSFHYLYTGINGHYHGIHQDFYPGSKPDYIGFYVRSGSNVLSDAYVVIYNAQRNAEIIAFFARSTGYFYVNGDVGGNTSVPYNALQWYHIEFKNIDWINKRFDYYVDGQLIQANITFRNAGLVDSMDRIYLYNFHTNSEGWWDNFIIGSEPVSWLSPNPSSGITPSNLSDNVILQIDAQNLTLGLHSANLITLSDAPSNPQILTPVQVNVVQNTPPTAVNDTVSVQEDISLNIDPLANDFDVDNDSLFIQSVDTTNTLGTLLFNPQTGNLQYTPPLNFNGNDSFQYTVTDGKGATDSASVLCMVMPVNDPPYVVSPVADVSYGEDSGVHTVVSDVSTVFADPDPGDILS